jgi:hypothetical protein
VEGIGRKSAADASMGGPNLVNLTAHNLKTIAEGIAHALVDTTVKGGSAFISTPLLYPSGSHVVVRLDGTGDRWFVSDDGYGHLEAQMMGGLSTFRRLAMTLADRAGVQFDERCFFVLEAEREALPGAVITLSNVSKQAVERTAFAIEERRIAISRDVFERRLIAAFDSRSIAHNISIVGASGKEWEVDAGITSDSRVERLFEFVTPRSASVAAAVMKFTDIRALESPPRTAAVLSDRSRTEAPLVSLLSRVAGAAIDAADAPEVYQRAA